MRMNMKLKLVEIENFRSIESVSIDFNPSCRILVGINESGKSNILKALSLLGESFSPKKEDVREASPHEKSIESSFIRFTFVLDEKERERVYVESKSKILAKKLSEPIVKLGTKSLSLKDFCHSIKHGLYRVDIEEEEKYAQIYSLGSSYQLLSNWKKPSADCPQDFLIAVGTEQKLLNEFVLINTADFPDIPDTYLSEADAEHLNSHTGKFIKKILKESLPKVIFWKYEKSNLLPSSVSIASFIENPDSCIPLKNMFLLAGITADGISTELQKAKDASSTKLRNLLVRVASHTNSHFQSVWKEHKGIKFALEPSGESIEPSILEKNHWQMSQRSDGMKRFFTFLLHISANVKANVLADALILVDEPDISLHPSGARYLKDELIEIAKKNYVVFSTHSIFMIDREQTERHLIVKKEKEKTRVEVASKSNIVDEEVLFNALNISVFDILRKNNIIFEGWRDKRLFSVAISKIPQKYKTALKLLPKIVEGIGLCHSEGVKAIRNITPVIELAGRRCFIVSDSDEAAKDKQEEYKTIRGFGDWYKYDDISKTCKAETGEDFLTETAFYSHIKGLPGKFSSLQTPFPVVVVGRLSAIKKWMLKQGVSPADTRDALHEIKSQIFDNLKVDDIDESYYDFLVELLPFIEKITKK